jgi:hypothetical protein
MPGLGEVLGPYSLVHGLAEAFDSDASADERIGGGVEAAGGLVGTTALAGTLVGGATGAALSSVAAAAAPVTAVAGAAMLGYEVGTKLDEALGISDYLSGTSDGHINHDWFRMQGIDEDYTNRDDQAAAIQEQQAANDADPAFQQRVQDYQSRQASATDLGLPAFLGDDPTYVNQYRDSLEGGASPEQAKQLCDLNRYVRISMTNAQKQAGTSAGDALANYAD